MPSFAFPVQLLTCLTEVVADALLRAKAGALPDSKALIGHLEVQVATTSSPGSDEKPSEEASPSPTPVKSLERQKERKQNTKHCIDMLLGLSRDWAEVI